MFSLGELFCEDVQPTSEQLFDLCEWVSRLRFFQQFRGDRVAAICNQMTLCRFEIGIRVSLQDRLYIILDGEFVVAEKDWTLRPGDTFGYRGKTGSVVASTEACVGSLDAETASRLFDSTDICWTPELSRTLLRTKTVNRTLDDLEVILDLLLKASAYVKNQPSDLSASIAKLGTLRTFSGNVDSLQGKGGDCLYIVLSGSIVIFGDEQERNSLRVYEVGDTFPREVIETALANRRTKREKLRRRGRKKNYENSLPSSFRVVSKTHRAELVEIHVEEFMNAAFPSTEIPFSLEFCRCVLLKRPTDRSQAELERLTTDLLQHLPFFAQLPFSTCKQLARTMELATITTSSSSLPGSKREIPSCLGVVLSGVLSIEYDDGESHVLKTCDIFGRRDILEPEQKTNHVVVETQSQSADIALLSRADYEKSVVPKQLTTGSSRPYPDLLDVIPSCVQKRLLARSCVKEFDSHRVLGPVDRSHGLILSGSVSVHYASTRDVDDDEDATERGKGDVEAVQLARRRIDDKRSRTAWEKQGMRECACILEAGHSLGAELFSSKKRSSFQDRRTNAGIAVCRQATRVLTFDPEKLCAKQPTARRAENLAALLASPRKDRRRLVTEDIIGVLSDDDELSRALPGPVKLRLAYAARVEHVDYGAVLETGTGALRIVLVGDFKVQVARELPASDVATLEKREVWTRLLDVGHLGAGDSFGGRHGDGGGIYGVASKLSEAYSHSFYEKTHALEAAAAAAVAQSAASALGASTESFSGRKFCSATCCSRLGATLLVVDVKDLCDAACLATNLTASVGVGIGANRERPKTTTSKLPKNICNRPALLRPTTTIPKRFMPRHSIRTDEESSVGSGSSEESLENHVVLSRRRKLKRVLTARDQAKLALLLASPPPERSPPFRPRALSACRTPPRGRERRRTKISQQSIK